MRLSHAEAQALVSARLDGPLDPVAERELNAHLATCDSCRAFNGSATRLARGLQSLPYLPASPAVTRAVLDRVSAPRSGWSRFMGSMPENAMPVATAIAAAVIIVFAGAFAIFQNLGDDDPESLPALTQETQNVAQQPDGTDQPETTEAGTDDPTGESDQSVTQAAFQTEEPGASTDEPEGAGQTEDAAPTEESLPVETEPTDAGTSATEEPAEQTEASGVTQEPEGDDGNGQTATESTNNLALQGSTETPEGGQVSEEPEARTQEQATEEPAVPTEEPSQPTEEPATEDVETQPVRETEAVSTSESDELLIGPSGRSISPTGTTAATQEPTSETTIEPTATLEPTPTATQEPTATSERTATIEPSPTATTEPTPTPTLEPTATTEPTSTATLEPTATAEPSATATHEPTATIEPTATATLEPTATTEPTPTPTEEMTPTLVPIIGRDDTPESDVPTEDSATEVTDGTGAASTEEAGQDGDESPLIEPSGDSVDGSGDGEEQTDGSDGVEEQPGTDNASDDGEEPVEGGDGTEGDDGAQVIEPQDGSDSVDDGGDQPVDGSPVDDTSDDGDSTDDGSSGDGNEQPTGTGSASVTLGTAPIYSGLGDVEGNPEQRLGLSADGTLIFSINPGRVSLESNGITVTGMDSAGGQAVHACDASGTCVDISSASRGDGSYTDTPIGWLNGDVIYERLNGDQYPVEFRAVSVDSSTLEPGQDRLLGGGDMDWETLIRPYPVDGGLLVPAPSAWLLITPDSVSAIDGNPAGQDITQIRITPATGIISYVTGGNLMLASLQSPGTPIATLPFTGGDYDFSPNGDRVAMLSDESLDIYDLDGNLLTSFPNPEGVNVGSLTWLNQGIVYVDFTGNVIRVIQP